MAEIALTNITKRWGDCVGVNDQSLTIRDREFFVLLGPSGCGKTTTMRMIAGLETPTSGEIRIGGRVVNDDLPKDRDVAMVFQNYGLYPHMTVYDNIAYPLKVRRTPKPDIRPRVEAAAATVELTPFLARKPGAMSGGQRQRVALARAIVRTPKLFLMDEPLSNLDARLRVTMRAELKHLQHTLKVTTLYVTHDQIEAMTLADRIAIMNHGVIQQLGTPEEIYNDPANIFVAGFIGSPAMNLIQGTLADGWFVPSGSATGTATGSATGTTTGTATGGTRLIRVGSGSRPRVVLGVRPEDVDITGPGRGDIDVPVYATENTGDSMLLTVRIGQQRVTARGDRHLRKRIDDRVGLRVRPDHLCLFDAETGTRIRDQGLLGGTGAGSAPDTP